MPAPSDPNNSSVAKSVPNVRCSRHQRQPTTRSTLAELYRCKRKAQGELGCQLRRIQTTAVSRNSCLRVAIAVNGCDSEDIECVDNECVTWMTMSVLTTIA